MFLCFGGDCWSVVGSFGFGFGGWFLGLGCSEFYVGFAVYVVALLRFFIIFVITFGLYWFG